MEGLGLEKKAMETIFMMQKMYHKILSTIMKSIPSCEASVEWVTVCVTISWACVVAMMSV